MISGPLVSDPPSTGLKSRKLGSTSCLATSRSAKLFSLISPDNGHMPPPSPVLMPPSACIAVVFSTIVMMVILRTMVTRMMTMVYLGCCIVHHDAFIVHHFRFISQSIDDTEGTPLGGLRNNSYITSGFHLPPCSSRPRLCSMMCLSPFTMKPVPVFQATLKP